jgi:hypothetical protein
MTGLVLVPGTWAWRGPDTKGEWYQDGSPFVHYLLSHGIEVWSRRRPFVWSTRIGGLPFPTSHLDWEAAGQNLFAYVDPARPDVGVSLTGRETRIIAHSHGLQVALYAAAAGCKIDTLVSVGSPIRRDMREIAIAARPNIRTWWQLAGGSRDWMQWLGEIFDGNLGIVRDAIYRDEHGKPVVWADQTVKAPTLNHSDWICNPDEFHRWQDECVLSLLKGDA